MDKTGKLWDFFYQKCAEQHGIPRIHWNGVQEGAKEGFSLSYSGGIVSASASNLPSAIYGLNGLRMAIASGNLSDCLGETTPRFPLRPLWLGSDLKVPFQGFIETACPTDVLNFDTLDKICRRTVELGFNAIIFGRREGMAIASHEQGKIDWNAVGVVLREYGLKMIVKVSLAEQAFAIHSPAYPRYQEVIEGSLREFLDTYIDIDYLFWESELLHPSFCTCRQAEEIPLKELVFHELKMLEQAIGKTSLIFYVPSVDHSSAKIHSKWLSELCDQAGRHTIIAFSALSGDFTQDHVPLHPFWNALRKEMECSSTPLLPIVNTGGVRQGEGLWPSIPCDLIDLILARCVRHHFAGIITLVNHIPPCGGMLDCSLWIASQALWKGSNPWLTAETWFAAHRPHWNYPLFEEDFKTIRRMVIHLSLMRSLTSEPHRDKLSSEEGKAISESLLAHLRALEIKWLKEKQENKEAKATLQDYGVFFLRDARRIILNFLQCFNISIPNLTIHEDVQESLWTQFLQSGGQGVRSGKVSLLEKPNAGQPGSRISQIFAENRLV